MDFEKDESDLKPFLKKDINKRTWFDIQVYGGFIGSLLRDISFYAFLVIMFVWWLIFYKFDIPIEYSIFKVFEIDKSYIDFYGTLTNLSNSLIAFLFATCIGIFINTYIKNFSLFTSALNEKRGLIEYFLSVVKWDKIKEEIKSKQRNQIMIDVMSEIMLYNTSEAYKLHHYMDEGIDPDLLPITQEMKDDIKEDILEITIYGRAIPEETKLNIMASKEMNNYIWMSRNGYLDPSDINTIVAYENNKSRIMTELKQSMRTKMPPMLTQPINIYFYITYIMLVPFMWKSYGFYIGSCFYVFTISIFFGINSGIRKMKNIFENPDINPTIHGNTIGWMCHNFAETAFNSFEIYLKKVGLHIVDDNSTVIV